MQAAGQALQARAKRLAPREEREIWRRASEGMRLAALQLAPPTPPTPNFVPCAELLRTKRTDLAALRCRRHDGGDRPGGAGAQTALVADHRAAIQVRLQCFGNANSTVGLLVHF